MIYVFRSDNGNFFLAEDGLPIAYMPYGSERLEYMGMLNTTMEGVLHNNDRVEAVHPTNVGSYHVTFYGKRVDRERLYDIVRGELVTTELRLASPNDITPEERTTNIIAHNGRVRRKTETLSPDKIIVELAKYAQQLRQMEHMLVV